MKDDKLIERARKLYAMSNDTSSPAEAAIALKRVTSMMQTHGITAEDLEQNRTQFGTTHAKERYKTVPTWYGILCVGVAKYHDCNVVLNDGQADFMGFDKDVLIAPLTLDYLLNTMERGVKRYQKEQKELSHYNRYGPSPRKQGSSYRRGYASEMQRIMCKIAEDILKEQEQATVESGGTALVIQKQSLVDEEFGKMRLFSSKREARSDANSAGAEGARNTRLNTQVNGTSGQGKLS